MVSLRILFRCMKSLLSMGLVLVYAGEGGFMNDETVVQRNK
jgi:hypothetical protein